MVAVSLKKKPKKYNTIYNYLKTKRKKKKNLGVNLTKHVQDLYAGNCKTRKTEIEEDLNKWKNILYSRIGRINIVSKLIFPKLVNRFNVMQSIMIKMF